MSDTILFKTARVQRLPGANYEGMKLDAWPMIHPSDKPIYDRMVARLVERSHCWSRRELAQAHRWLHYALEREP